MLEKNNSELIHFANITKIIKHELPAEYHEMMLHVDLYQFKAVISFLIKDVFT